jgi:hypothetical protein
LKIYSADFNLKISLLFEPLLILIVLPLVVILPLKPLAARIAKSVVDMFAVPVSVMLSDD